ncbi:MAG: hypothetical protein WAM30_19195 [Candidatus Dormiibacterota bacterium]
MSTAHGSISMALPLDWNPITSPWNWLASTFSQYLSGLFTKDSAGQMLGGLVPVGKGIDPLTAAAANPVVQVTNKCGFGGAASAACSYHGLAANLDKIGFALLAVVLLARLFRLAAQGQLQTPVQVLLDLAPRGIVGITAMCFGGQVLALAVQFAMATCITIAEVFLQAASLTSPTSIVAVVGTVDSAVLILPTLVLVLQYLSFLLMVAQWTLILGSMLAPLWIPLLVYAGDARLAMLWLRLTISCLLVPVVCTIGVASAFALMSFLNQMPGLGTLSGAFGGDVALIAVAIVVTAIIRDAFHQGKSAVKGSFHAVHLGAIAEAPGMAVARLRQAGTAGRGAARMAGGDPTGALELASAFRDHGGSGAGAGGGAASAAFRVEPGHRFGRAPASGGARASSGDGSSPAPGYQQPITGARTSADGVEMPGSRPSVDVEAGRYARNALDHAVFLAGRSDHSPSGAGSASRPAAPSAAFTSAARPVPRPSPSPV